MTYIPTRETLELLWFKQLENKAYVLYEDETENIAFLYYDHPDDKFPWYFPSFHVNSVNFYPRSLSDLENLIKMFTPE
jgi:hypothetical protein